MTNIRDLKGTYLAGSNDRWLWDDFFVSGRHPELAGLTMDVPQLYLDRVGRLACMLNMVERYLQSCYSNVSPHEILVVVTSAYRSGRLNDRTPGASDTSQHLSLEAVDFTLSNSSLLEMAYKFIQNVIGGLGYSDLILYRDKNTKQCTHIHWGMWKHNKEPQAREVTR